MATASATICQSSTIPNAAVLGSPKSPQKRTTRVKFINGLNSFGGLKAHNSVAQLGVPVCTEQSFANFVKQQSSGGGGATCSAVAEIFRIAAIMNGLTLVGVAVGFVLLRIEAFVEEE